MIINFVLLTNLLILLEAKQLIDYINAQNIVDNLRDYTTEPHVAGTAANKRVADKILAKWKSYGLEGVNAHKSINIPNLDVRFDSYKVLLSYPNYTNPNHIRIWSKEGEVVFESSGISPAIIPKEQGAPNAGVQWLAYSANGSFVGEILCEPLKPHHSRTTDILQLWH